MADKYKFDKLVEPAPGCGYARYWKWYVKDHGRWLFKETMQEHSDNLAPDPWIQGDGSDV